MPSQKNERPKVGSRSRGNTNRHFLAVGCPNAGKTTLLATGLRRLQCLGAYSRVEYSEKFGAQELESTNHYPNYRCTVPWKLAKGRAAITACVRSAPKDWWHDCDGSLFAGPNGTVGMAKPLRKAAKQVSVVFYVSPADVVLRSDGQLNQQWVDEVRNFGKNVGRSKWWSDIMYRKRRLCLVISKAELVRKPGLSAEALGKILQQIGEKNDLAEHYDAAFLVRATTNRLREEALDRGGWEPCVEERMKAGNFLDELKCIGLADGDLRIKDGLSDARFCPFESAVPLAWAAGFVNDKALEAYPKCFSKFC